MAQAVLKFAELTVPEIVLRTREIVTATDKASSTYTDPDPTLASITASVDLLESDYNLSRKKGPALTNVMKLQLKSHLALMVLFLAYVQRASGGDATKIELTTLTVKGAPQAAKKLGRILSLRGHPSETIGATELSWKSVPGVRSYAIQISPDNITWTDRDESPTKASVTITGLVPESFSYYRVAGINTAGRGAYSTPVKVGAG